MMKTNALRTLLLCTGLSGALLLAGCGGNMQDLKDFVAHTKQAKSSRIQPAPTVTPYTPYSYVIAKTRNPFRPPKSERKTKPKMMHKNNGVHPDFKRKREPLEKFPLDSLRMVGTIQADGTLYALISSPDGRVHRVSPGNYMGQNYGKIVEITPKKVVLREIVPNGFGGYTKQPASIALSVPSS